MVDNQQNKHMQEFYRVVLMINHIHDYCKIKLSQIQYNNKLTTLYNNQLEQKKHVDIPTFILNNKNIKNIVYIKNKHSNVGKTRTILVCQNKKEKVIKRLKLIVSSEIDRGR